jgi:glyoxylase-like metal-dependent hydrolase (beta-lactamase superfamily II)
MNPWPQLKQGPRVRSRHFCRPQGERGEIGLADSRTRENRFDASPPFVSISRVIPLEDTFTDVLGKAQRGLKLSDDQLAARAGISIAELAASKEGAFSEPVLRRLAPALGLGTASLLALAKKAWRPAPVGSVPGLAAFNTPYEDMTVNCYLVWDPASRKAAAFDTGATAEPMLLRARAHGLAIEIIFLTHTHRDHIADLARLRQETSAPVYVGRDENFPGGEPIEAGRTFRLGALSIEARQTAGHAAGGISYVATGLSRPVAVVGDALFASSMGGGMVSYEQALRTNRENLFTLPDETIVCPGHGPLTTIGEEKQHNPFYPEFQH